MQFVIIREVQGVCVLQKVFFAAHLPWFLSLKQLTSRNKETATLHSDSSYSLGIHQKHFSSFRKRRSSDRQSGTQRRCARTMSLELDAETREPRQWAEDVIPDAWQRDYILSLPKSSPWHPQASIAMSSHAPIFPKQEGREKHWFDEIICFCQFTSEKLLTRFSFSDYKIDTCLLYEEKKIRKYKKLAVRIELGRI